MAMEYDLDNGLALILLYAITKTMDDKDFIC